MKGEMSMENLECLVDKSGIYKIENQINGKCYIGQSKNIKKRVLYHHFCDFKNENNCCYNSKFYQALRKYGIENFRVSILEECENLDERETYWIHYYDSFKSGYNSTEGGQSWGEKIHSLETQEKRLKTLSETKALQDENHPRAKLSNEEVILIRQRYIDGESCEEIYKDYDTKYTLGSFKKIIFGNSYKRVGNIPPKEDRRHTNAKFTADQIREIRSMEKSGVSITELASKFNVSHGTMYKIVKGKTYTNIK